MNLFRESYSSEGPEEALTTTSFAPPVDIYEDEHTITLKMEVPGIDEKDIDVRIEGNTLAVHGEKHEFASPAFPVGLALHDSPQALFSGPESTSRAINAQPAFCAG